VITHFYYNAITVEKKQHFAFAGAQFANSHRQKLKASNKQRLSCPAALRNKKTGNHHRSPVLDNPKLVCNFFFFLIFARNHTV